MKVATTLFFLCMVVSVQGESGKKKGSKKKSGQPSASAASKSKSSSSSFEPVDLGSPRSGRSSLGGLADLSVSSGSVPPSPRSTGGHRGSGSKAPSTLSPRDSSSTIEAPVLSNPPTPPSGPKLKKSKSAPKPKTTKKSGGGRSSKST